MIRDTILIIGAMKSGTTTLFAQLDAHPAIAGANPKEPGFFAFEEVHSMGWDWYENLFGFDPETHRYALDGSTDYTKAPFTDRVQERVRAAESAGRRYRLIYIMRHPVDRLESHARHTAIKGIEIARNRSPRKDHGLDAGLSPVNEAVSRYSEQLEHWRDWHERGDLHLLTLEGLTSDGAAEMGRIGKFLDLPDLTFTEARAQENKGTEKTRQSQLYRQLSSVGPLHKVATALVPTSARAKVKTAMRPKAKVEGRFSFTDQERAELNARYAGEAERLKQHFGFDPGWTF